MAFKFPNRGAQAPAQQPAARPAAGPSWGQRPGAQGQRPAAGAGPGPARGARPAPRDYDPLDDVANAEIFQRLPYIPTGTHLANVDEVQVKDTRSGRMFIVTISIEQSGNPDVTPGVYGTSFNLSDQYGYGIRDTKKFLVAVLGEVPGDPEGEARLADALTKESIYEMAGEDQPLRDRKVEVTGFNKATRGGPSAKNPEGVVTNYSWMPVDQ